MRPNIGEDFVAQENRDIERYKDGHKPRTDQDFFSPLFLATPTH